MTRVKICGITNIDDALTAVDAGADALGFVLYKGSPRYVPPERIERIIARLPPFVTTVGVFVNEPAARVNALARRCRLHAVQLHGDEPPELCDRIERTVIKAWRVRDAGWQTAVESYHVHALLLDAYAKDRYGGTGHTFDWNVIGASVRRIILSGGLTPENVSEAIRQVRPYGVDTSSGVEAEPGVKDHAKIRAFVEAVRKTET